jgi:hypothetical protein
LDASKRCLQAWKQSGSALCFPSKMITIKNSPKLKFSFEFSMTDIGITMINTSNGFGSACYRLTKNAAKFTILVLQLPLNRNNTSHSIKFCTILQSLVTGASRPCM